MIVERVELRKMSTDTCIKRLCVRNFMCHKDIGMALLGERINFIIGVNGNIHVTVQENEFLVARKVQRTIECRHDNCKQHCAS
ncbi:hypothetical protein T01_12859 [Trichinella spiralis]|uniref:Uncharacterized protein n=1 Tax=Trichinella spiralis TaxID=6334 RepID=A0A0V1AYX9_TRISP|nr:hypothetical protein T01_12859 [Trichinella spiralis]